MAKYKWYRHKKNSLRSKWNDYKVHYEFNKSSLGWLEDIKAALYTDVESSMRQYIGQPNTPELRNHIHNMSNNMYTYRVGDNGEIMITANAAVPANEIRWVHGNNIHIDINRNHMVVE